MSAPPAYLGGTHTVMHFKSKFLYTNSYIDAAGTRPTRENMLGIIYKSSRNIG